MAQHGHTIGVADHKTHLCGVTARLSSHHRGGKSVAQIDGYRYRSRAGGE